MDSIYYNVSSITNAMRGKSLLERNGMSAYVHRAIEEDGSNGCGYSILVTGDPDRIENLLSSAGIRVRGRRYAGESGRYP